MTTWNEAVIGNTPPLGSLLKAGDEFLSGNEQVVFQQYNKVILPLDGWVFWVLNSPVKTFTAKGSLHVSIETEQHEDKSISMNNIIFTSEVVINQLNSVNSRTMWIADLLPSGLGYVKFAFNSMKKHYRQADLWHYVGFAVYADQRSNIVDNLATLDLTQVLVSNSLPIWLFLNNYTPSHPAYGSGNNITLYPSFLVPENILPPYASIHIEPNETFGIGAAPCLDIHSSHYQLCSDMVRITLYGLNNNQAQDFLDCVYQFSQDYDYIGLMNIPIIRDEKIPQSEILIISQKKTITFHVSYYQTSVRDIARQMLTDFVNTYSPRSVIHNSEPPPYPIIPPDPYLPAPWST